MIATITRRVRPTAAGSAAGLTPTKVAVLMRAVRAGPLRLSQIADAEGINPTMLSRVVGALCETGLLERSSDVGDKRAAWVKPTQAGRRVAERIRRERTDALSVALAALDANEQRAIDHALPALEQLSEHLIGGRP